MTGGPMQPASKVHRRAAAALISTRARYPVSESVLRFWERQGLLRPDVARCRGPRHPARYSDVDLLAGELIARLRADGQSLHHARRMLRELANTLGRVEPLAPRKAQ